VVGLGLGAAYGGYYPYDGYGGGYADDGYGGGYADGGYGGDMSPYDSYADSGYTGDGYSGYGNGCNCGCDDENVYGDGQDCDR
jgi:hypothetical protein